MFLDLHHLLLHVLYRFPLEAVLALDILVSPSRCFLGSSRLALRTEMIEDTDTWGILQDGSYETPYRR